MEEGCFVVVIAVFKALCSGHVLLSLTVEVLVGFFVALVFSNRNNETSLHTQ